MTLLAVTWWFLVNVYGTHNRVGDGPKAKGPFPSLALCRVAGESMFPGDHRFWTPERVAIAKRKAEEEARAYALRRSAELIVKRKPDTRQTIELESGERVTFNEKNEEVGSDSAMVSGYMSMSSGPVYSALTSCTSDAGEVLEAMQP